MLSLTNLSQDACLGTATLETLQSAIDGLAIFYTNLRHLYFPPSRMPGKPQHLRAINHGFNVIIISVSPSVVKENLKYFPPENHFFSFAEILSGKNQSPAVQSPGRRLSGLRRPAGASQSYWGLTIRLISRFFTRMVLTICIPSVAFWTFSTVRAAAFTASSSLSTGMVTVPFILPLT